MMTPCSCFAFFFVTSVLPQTTMTLLYIVLSICRRHHLKCGDQCADSSFHSRFNRRFVQGWCESEDYSTLRTMGGSRMCAFGATGRNGGFGTKNSGTGAGHFICPLRVHLSQCYERCIDNDWKIEHPSSLISDTCASGLALSRSLKEVRSMVPSPFFDSFRVGRIPIALECRSNGSRIVFTIGNCFGDAIDNWNDQLRLSRRAKGIGRRYYCSSRRRLNLGASIKGLNAATRSRPGRILCGDKTSDFILESLSLCRSQLLLSLTVGTSGGPSILSLHSSPVSGEYPEDETCYHTKCRRLLSSDSPECRQKSSGHTNRLVEDKFHFHKWAGRVLVPLLFKKARKHKFQLRSERCYRSIIRNDNARNAHMKYPKDGFYSLGLFPGCPLSRQYAGGIFLSYVVSERTGQRCENEAGEGSHSEGNEKGDKGGGGLEGEREGGGDGAKKGGAGDSDGNGGGRDAGGNGDFSGNGGAGEDGGGGGRKGNGREEKGKGGDDEEDVDKCGADDENESEDPERREGDKVGRQTKEISRGRNGGNADTTWTSGCQNDSRSSRTVNLKPSATALENNVVEGRNYSDSDSVGSGDGAFGAPSLPLFNSKELKHATVQRKRDRRGSEAVGDIHRGDGGGLSPSISDVCPSLYVKEHHGALESVDRSSLSDGLSPLVVTERQEKMQTGRKDEDSDKTDLIPPQNSQSSECDVEAETKTVEDDEKKLKKRLLESSGGHARASPSENNRCDYDDVGACTHSARGRSRFSVSHKERVSERGTGDREGRKERSKARQNPSDYGEGDDTMLGSDTDSTSSASANESNLASHEIGDGNDERGRRDPLKEGRMVEKRKGKDGARSLVVNFGAEESVDSEKAGLPKHVQQHLRDIDSRTVDRERKRRRNIAESGVVNVKGTKTILSTSHPQPLFTNTGGSNPVSHQQVHLEQPLTRLDQSFDARGSPEAHIEPHVSTISQSGKKKGRRKAVKDGAAVGALSTSLSSTGTAGLVHESSLCVSVSSGGASVVGVAGSVGSAEPGIGSGGLGGSLKFSKAAAVTDDCVAVSTSSSGNAAGGPSHHNLQSTQQPQRHQHQQQHQQPVFFQHLQKVELQHQNQPPQGLSPSQTHLRQRQQYCNRVSLNSSIPFHAQQQQIQHPQLLQSGISHQRVPRHHSSGQQQQQPLTHIQQHNVDRRALSFQPQMLVMSGSDKNRHLVVLSPEQQATVAACRSFLEAQRDALIAATSATQMYSPTLMRLENLLKDTAGVGGQIDGRTHTTNPIEKLEEKIVQGYQKKGKIEFEQSMRQVDLSGTDRVVSESNDGDDESDSESDEDSDGTSEDRDNSDTDDSRFLLVGDHWRKWSAWQQLSSNPLPSWFSAKWSNRSSTEDEACGKRGSTLNGNRPLIPSGTAMSIRGSTDSDAIRRKRLLDGSAADEIQQNQPSSDEFLDLIDPYDGSLGAEKIQNQWPRNRISGTDSILCELVSMVKMRLSNDERKKHRPSRSFRSVNGEKARDAAGLNRTTSSIAALDQAGERSDTDDHNSTSEGMKNGKEILDASRKLQDESNLASNSYGADANAMQSNNSHMENYAMDGRTKLSILDENTPARVHASDSTVNASVSDSLSSSLSHSSISRLPCCGAGAAAVNLEGCVTPTTTLYHKMSCPLISGRGSTSPIITKNWSVTRHLNTNCLEDDPTPEEKYDFSAFVDEHGNEVPRMLSNSSCIGPRKTTVSGSKISDSSSRSNFWEIGGSVGGSVVGIVSGASSSPPSSQSSSSALASRSFTTNSCQFASRGTENLPQSSCSSSFASHPSSSQSVLCGRDGIEEGGLKGQDCSSRVETLPDGESRNVIKTLAIVTRHSGGISANSTTSHSRAGVLLRSSNGCGVGRSQHSASIENRPGRKKKGVSIAKHAPSSAYSSQGTSGSPSSVRTTASGVGGRAITRSCHLQKATSGGEAGSSLRSKSPISHNSHSAAAARRQLRAGIAHERHPHQYSRKTSALSV